MTAHFPGLVQVVLPNTHIHECTLPWLGTGVSITTSFVDTPFFLILMWSRRNHGNKIEPKPTRHKDKSLISKHGA
jgi:hypothetical protein